MSKLHVFTISRDVENGQQVIDSTQVGFHLCSLNEWLQSTRRDKGQGSDTTGYVNTGLGLPEMPGCCQYWILSSKWQLTNHLSKLHDLTALMSHLNALVNNDNHCIVMSRYQAQPRWELTAMLGRLAVIGLSYYHERALCWNNEILHKNILSLSFSTLKLYRISFSKCCIRMTNWSSTVQFWFDLHLIELRITCQILVRHASFTGTQIRAWCHQVITSLFHISNGSAHILAEHTPDRSCLGQWNSLSDHGIKTCALLDKLSNSFVNYYLTYEEFRTI